jgi:hypothetical protein
MEDASWVRGIEHGCRFVILSEAKDLLWQCLNSRSFVAGAPQDDNR